MYEASFAIMLLFQIALQCIRSSVSLLLLLLFWCNLMNKWWSHDTSICRKTCFNLQTEVVRTGQNILTFQKCPYFAVQCSLCSKDMNTHSISFLKTKQAQRHSLTLKGYLGLRFNFSLSPLYYLVMQMFSVLFIAFLRYPFLRFQLSLRDSGGEFCCRCSQHWKITFVGETTSQIIQRPRFGTGRTTHRRLV